MTWVSWVAQAAHHQAMCFGRLQCSQICTSQCNPTLHPRPPHDKGSKATTYARWWHVPHAGTVRHDHVQLAALLPMPLLGLVAPPPPTVNPLQVRYHRRSRHSRLRCSFSTETSSGVVRPWVLQLRLPLLECLASVPLPACA